MAGQTHSQNGVRDGSRAGQATVAYRFPRKRRWRWLVPYSILLAAVLLIAGLWGLIYLRPPSPSLVVATVPYWNIDDGTTSVLSNPNTFSEVSPWIYGLNSSGQIVPQYEPAHAAIVNAQLAR